jgi:hypothetical protein
MTKKYYIIDDVWEIIKLFMYHNIKKHGKHLMIDDKNICKYNEVVKSIPIIQIPRSGPQIIYNSATKKFRVAKFLYHGKKLNVTYLRRAYCNTIIETIPMNQYRPDSFTIFWDLTKKKKIYDYYHQNTMDVVSKLRS